MPLESTVADPAGCEAHSTRRDRRDVVASMFPQRIIFVAIRAFIACVRIRLVDGGRNQGGFPLNIIRSVSRMTR
ncbi:hypothetical protein [Burkholderia lata]|jgi:hypothetical protein|uniref:hypothetical protein n=1 Tax=Burkholderia lata (strain ATCC 17760 / DSM 23089 / LMG 22485 / NCIMB 9086 / R18194 / 383) TaxID=482957 RepID=UPI001584059D|nr:hypothetical protein [Burkholderia lata]